MFYYISFLRPPPTTASLNGNVTITPQITNDLRTEFFPGTQDLFYSWQLCRSPDSTLTNLGDQSTRLAKLTTWRESVAYKELPVPSPSNARDGQAWRLVLTSMDVTYIDLHTIDTTFGNKPFPVHSMPILFTSRKVKSAEKQEQIERWYRLPHDVPVYVRIREQLSFDLDKKVWDSGVALSSWLVELSRRSPPESSVLGKLKNRLFSSAAKKFLELGAGTGIVSLMLATLRSIILPQEDDKAQIFATDLCTVPSIKYSPSFTDTHGKASAIMVLSQNIELNKSLIPHLPPKAAVLDWDNPKPDEVLEPANGYDLVIMADVTYNTASFRSLVHTLQTVTSLGPTHPVVLLGYKERDKAERMLWDMARAIGIHFEMIDKCPGAGGTPVEVWLGEVRK